MSIRPMGGSVAGLAGAYARLSESVVGAASRATWPTTLSGTGYTQPSETAKIEHIALVDITSLDLWYVNAYNNDAGNGLIDGPSTLTLRASVELLDGTIIRAASLETGSRTLTLDPGAMARLTVPVVIAKGAKFYTRTYVSVPASGQWPYNTKANYVLNGSVTTIYGYDTVLAGNVGTGAGSGEGTNQGSGGADVTAGGAISTGYVNAYGPCMMTATTPAAVPVVGFFGDSIITEGVDFPQLGWAARAAIGAGISYIRCSLSGDYASAFLVQSKRGWRSRFIRHVTHGICEYGRNDLSGGNNLATIQANLIAIWTLLLGYRIKTWQTTITPKVTSTDNFTTLANQTPTSDNAVRLNLNAWIRDGAPMLNGAAVATGSNAAGTVRAGQTGHPLVGYIEVADVVESARDSGKWAVDRVRTVTDAVSDTTNFNTKFVITSATGAFTSADVGKQAIVSGAGSAGGLFQALIVGVESSTKIHVASAVSTAGTGLTLTLGPATADGIHPTPDRHMTLAGVVPTASFVLS